MKRISLYTLVLALSATLSHAGSLKLPGGNLTRNAGQSVPVSVQASGFAAGARATVYLVNAKTWVSQPYLFDVPIVNGTQTIQVPIDWSFWETGTYVVKVVVGSNLCTSTWLLRIRSAVIWPYSGKVWSRGQVAEVVWTLPPLTFVDIVDVYIQSETGDEPFILLANDADPEVGHAGFTIPDDLEPGTYRLYLDGYLLIPMEDENGPFFWPDLTEETRSERVIIQ